jgi:hypothetical protein
LTGREQDLLSDVTAAWLSGMSWRAIGAVLGMSRQAASRRFGLPVREAAQAVIDEQTSSG